MIVSTNCLLVKDVIIRRKTTQLFKKWIFVYFKILISMFMYTHKRPQDFFQGEGGNYFLLGKITKRILRFFF